MIYSKNKKFGFELFNAIFVYFRINKLILPENGRIKHNLRKMMMNRHCVVFLDWENNSINLFQLILVDQYMSAFK